MIIQKAERALPYLLDLWLTGRGKVLSIE